MRAQPELYEQLKGKTTKLGVNLGHCIKTGVDNKGRYSLINRVIGVHGHIKAIQWSKPSEWSVVTRNHSSSLLHCLILLFLPAIEVMQLMLNIQLTLTFQKSGKLLPNGSQRLLKVKTSNFWYRRLWESSSFNYDSAIDFSDTKMDPTGKYILTTRCRTGRSVRGFRLPPCCSFEERREIERVLVKGLQKLEGDLAGEYFPLAG